MALTNQGRNDVVLASQPSYGSSRDALRDWVWDSALCPAARQELTYFTGPINSAFGGGVKGRNETSLTNNGTLPNTQTFLVEKVFVKVPIFGVGAADAATLAQQAIQVLQSSVINLALASHDYDMQIHGSMFTPAIATTGDAGAVGVSNSSFYVASGCIKLAPIPIIISNLVSFSMTQNIANATSGAAVDTAMAALNAAATRFIWVLEGVRTRGK